MYLHDEANAVKIQKHQVNKSEDKLAEIDCILSSIQSEQEENDFLLDDLLLDMEVLIESNGLTINSQVSEEDISFIERQIEVDIRKEDILLIDKQDDISINEDIPWEKYMASIKEYGIKHDINLKEDPFKTLMTKSQRAELHRRIKDEFTLKNAHCDKYDYMIAGTCGVIAGLVDSLFVGAPGDSKLGDIADEHANKITEKFAEIMGWDKSKAEARASDTTKSAIGYLEKKFKINYDQASTNGKNGTGGLIKNLSPKNHHLKSLAHSPDIIGLFFSILNQFTNTSSFISDGKIITIETDESNLNKELRGHNFVAKIFCGFANWFGHLMSDWTGSSGAKGRGSGVPIPFYNLLQLIDIGEFGKHNQSFATITTKIFEEGYDARHSMAMAVPVLINELLIRFMYTMKSKFYYQKEWKECIPKGNVPEVRRMLLVGHGVLCLIDGVDAIIRAKLETANKIKDLTSTGKKKLKNIVKIEDMEIINILLRMNIIAWSRFGNLALREVYAWYNSGHIDPAAVDDYIEKDLQRMLNKK